jgi:dienelactone hydrolase
MIQGTFRRTFLAGVWATFVLTAALFALPTGGQAGLPLWKAKETKTSFQSGDQTISVWRFTPNEGKGPFPGVVLLYGIDGWDELPKTQLLYKTVAGKLAEKGFVVHFIHYFERTPLDPKDLEEIKAGLLTQVLEKPGWKSHPQLADFYRKWMDTVKTGIEQFKKSDDVDPDRIGLLGLSMGGFISTSLVVRDPELKIRALANVFGGLPPELRETVAAAKPKLPPLLILGAEEDETVPERFQRAVFDLWRSTGNKAEAHFYSGVGHGFFDKQRNTVDLDIALNEALPTALRFFRRNLQAAPK